MFLGYFQGNLLILDSLEPTNSHFLLSIVNRVLAARGALLAGDWFEVCSLIPSVMG